MYLKGSKVSANAVVVVIVQIWSSVPDYMSEQCENGVQLWLSSALWGAEDGASGENSLIKTEGAVLTEGEAHGKKC